MNTHQPDRFNQVCDVIAHQVASSVVIFMSRVVLMFMFRAIGYVLLAWMINAISMRCFEHGISFTGALIGIWSYFIINTIINTWKTQSTTR